MEDDVDVLGRADEPIAVADVADEEPHVAPRAELLALVELLGLVTTEDPHDRGVRLEHAFDETSPDRSRSPGDEHAAASERLWVQDGATSVVNAGTRSSRRLSGAA